MPIPIGVMIGLQLASMVMGTVGKVKEGNAAKRLGEFNAKVAEQQAADALIRGKEDEQQFRLSMKGVIGRQRAGFAGQGVDVTQGTPVDVQADAAFLGELDALRIRTNAQRESWGYQMDAQNSRMGGANAQSASRWGAATTVLGGGAQTVSILASRYGWTGGPTPGRS